MIRVLRKFYSNFIPIRSSSSSNVFSLFAPTVAQVNLLGSFSNWRPIEMIKDTKTGIFHLPANYSIPDGEHEYKYSIKNSSQQTYWTSIIDPYVEKYNKRQDYGLMRTYEGKKFDELYDWQYDHIVLPENDRLIIYELYVADFTDRGHFRALVEKLDYLVSLGINAIQLMPIQDYLGKEHHWGYTPTHHFALKTNYGSRSDLKYFIDQCHRHGIRVFFDGIFHYSSSACPLVHIDRKYWFHQTVNDRQQFNYDHYDEKLHINPALRYAEDLVRYWIGEFHFDGIRFDSVKTTNNDPVLIVLDKLARSLRPNHPFFTQIESSHRSKKFNALPDAYWSSEFHQVLTKTILDADQFDIERLKSMISTRNIVNFISSHHRNRYMYFLEQDDALPSFQCVRLASTLLLTSLGIPRIWQGEEFGDARQLNVENRQRTKLPMQWSLLNEPENRDLFHFFQRLIDFRNRFLNSNNVDFIDENISPRILAYTRSNETVLIVVNFTNQMKTQYEIKTRTNNQRWCDLFTNDVYAVDDFTLTLDLAPYDAKVLLRNS